MPNVAEAADGIALGMLVSIQEHAAFYDHGG